MKIGNKIKNKMLDIIVGPRRTIRIKDIYVGPEENVTYGIPAGAASGSPMHIFTDTTKGKRVTITVTDLETGESLASDDYYGCDMRHVPTDPSIYMFPIEGIETLLKLKGKDIEIRYKKHLPDYLIEHILTKYGSMIK